MAKEIVLVTGSCGRIGTALVKKLGEKYQIVGFELLKAIYASPSEELVPVDLSSDESVAQAFSHIKEVHGRKILAVIHLAAYYSFKEQHSDKYEKITVQGTERLLNALKDFEVGQFIFTSTMLLHAPTVPGCPITENSPVCPKWDYPLSKVHTEKVIHRLRGKIPAVILRVAGVYDDQCHSIPISQQIQRIYEKTLESHLFAGDVSHGASFIHMDDLVRAILLAIEKRHSLPPELPLLLGEEKTLSYEELQNLISCLLYGKGIRTISVPKWFAKIGAWVEDHIQHDSFIKPWMIDLADDHYELNIDLAKTMLDWSPKHSLEGTLPKMIQDLQRDPTSWYKKNGLPLSRSMKKRASHEN
jgi:nucleoside-diphosphate-sugar epimerase